MKKSTLLIPAAVAGLASLLLSTAAVAGPHGQGRAAVRSHTGAAGNTVTHTTRVERMQNGRTRQDQVLVNGELRRERNATVTRDREAGTRTRDVAVTNGQGDTLRTVHDVTQRTDDGYTRSTDVVGRAGGTTSRDVDVSRDAETGVKTRTVTVERTPPAPPQGN
jgi:hypothetical protein